MTQGMYGLAMVSEEYGEFIAHAVRTFAEDRRLNYDLWHKDAPLWIITDLPWPHSNIGPRVNKLEIGLFRTDSFLEIKVLPDAYQIEMGQRKCIQSGLRQELSRSVPFDEFLVAVNQKGRDGAHNILQPKLSEAWEGVVAVDNDQLTPPTG